MTLEVCTRLLVVIALIGCGGGGGERARDRDAAAGLGGDAGAVGDAAVGGDDGGDLASGPGRPDAGAAVPGAPSSDAGASMSGPRPQTNVSFETAQRLEPDGPAWLQDERSAVQVDYYVWSGRAGEFYEITTDRGTFMPDNTIAVYDEDRTLLARNDDGGVWGGDGIDARLVVRLPRDGDYYVTVEDPFTPELFFRSPFPLLYYHVRLRTLTEDADGVAIARDEAPVQVRFVQDERTGYAHALLLAELGAGERAFDFTGIEGRALIGHVLASGPDANGSTAQGGELRVTDGSDRVLSRIDRERGQHDFHPPVSDADYRVTLGAIEDPGDNGFHAVDLVLLPDNPAEQEEDANGEQSTAEPITFEGTTFRRGLVLLQLPPGDVDHFALDVIGGEYVVVVCEAESGGSGVRGLRAELIDDGGVVGSAAETPDTNLAIPVVQVTQTGTMFLRVWSDDVGPETGVEPWARCAIDTGP